MRKAAQALHPLHPAGRAQLTQQGHKLQIPGTNLNGSETPPLCNAFSSASFLIQKVHWGLLST